MTSLLGLEPRALERFLADLGEKPFRARQVSRWLHQRFADDSVTVNEVDDARWEAGFHKQFREPLANGGGILGGFEDGGVALDE